MHPRPWFILNIDLKLFSPLINTHFPLCVFSSWQLWYCEWQPVNLTSILEISSEGSQTNCGWISFPQHNDSCSITTSHQAKKLNSLITLHLLFFFTDHAADSEKETYCFTTAMLTFLQNIHITLLWPGYHLWGLRGGWWSSRRQWSQATDCSLRLCFNFCK